MTTLGWILAASVLGGGLSVCAAAFMAFSARPSWVPMLVSYAIGALLGAVFLEVLPTAFESGKEVHHVALVILLGILGFFVLEKLVLWRHCHSDHCEAHDPHAAHDHGRSGLMVTVGDTFHNFVDGIIIAGAFMTSTELGLATALAIIAHEIPQEVGDFLILLHSGYSKTQALALNLLSSLAMLAGGVLAYYALQGMQNLTPYLLGIAAASMIYVAVADLIPGLHKRPEIHATIQQVALIALGILSIGGVGMLIGEHH
jgi:zinc and cadmium transporter